MTIPTHHFTLCNFFFKCSQCHARCFTDIEALLTFDMIKVHNVVWILNTTVLTWSLTFYLYDPSTDLTVPVPVTLSVLLFVFSIISLLSSLLFLRIFVWHGSNVTSDLNLVNLPLDLLGLPFHVQTILLL